MISFWRHYTQVNKKSVLCWKGNQDTYSSKRILPISLFTFSMWFQKSNSFGDATLQFLGAPMVRSPGHYICSHVSSTTVQIYHMDSSWIIVPTTVTHCAFIALWKFYSDHCLKPFCEFPNNILFSFLLRKNKPTQSATNVLTLWIYPYRGRTAKLHFGLAP